MKRFLIVSLLVNSLFTQAQKSEDYIPKAAVTVFSLNNINILQKVSMDELVSYDFMTELQSELFDGSTQGKTLKDAGIDFNQKMNIFYGKNKEFEISGFTFGISNREQLFTVFDDFDRRESSIPNTEYYNNYFNHLMIRGNIGLLIRVDTDQERLSEITDSIWVERGFELPYVYENTEFYDEEFETYDNPLDENEMNNDGTDAANMDVNEEVSEEDELLKNYYALRDSLETEMSLKHLYKIFYDIYDKGINLKATDKRLADQLLHETDGIFYLDNSRSFKNNNSLWYFQTMFPELYRDLNNLYQGNVMLGDIYLRESSVDMNLVAYYGDALGTIYNELNNAGFDKHVLDYIPANNSGFFTYNIDLKKGYENAYDIIIPILSEEKNPRISANVLVLELLNEFVDTDELFKAYKGSMFGTFNGIKRVKTTRIEFNYDETTFEYNEQEIESEEDMPIFTIGFSTAKPEIPEKILRHLSRLTTQFHQEGNYWVFEDAILNSVPLYMINKNGLFIFTNDEDLAKNHSNGYGSERLKGKAARKAKKSGSVYAYSNLGEVVDKIPEQLLYEQGMEFIRSMKGKKGEMEIVSSKTSKDKTTYDIQFRFDEKYPNGGKYLLDLINSAYNLSKAQ